MLKEQEITQLDFFNLKTRQERKELGQFFTNPILAQYMASMIHKIEGVDKVKVLDAGAGEGILTSAAAQRLVKLGHKNIHAILYEIDQELIPVLLENMNWVKDKLKEVGAAFSFEIRNKDFILSRPDWREKDFHVAVINPPYFKISSKDSPYSGATFDLFTGNPNIYASFMAVVSACLSAFGQMITIVPRSFTNGLYFKSFRYFLFNKLSLERIHIFKSRNNLFGNMDVLQENIICKYVKIAQQETIMVCSSKNDEDLDESEVNFYSANLIMDTNNKMYFIRIPESIDDANILNKVEHWRNTFGDCDYFISTGPIVEHRTKKFIVDKGDAENSIPLLRMHNVRPLQTIWTGKKIKDARFKLLDGYQKHVSRNLVYVVLKRFSSKDENRRLVAAVHNPEEFTGDFIALENHLNFIGQTKNELDMIEAFGLAALFNSTFMDRYFRSISGNTQVNASEIRSMKLPEKSKILKIGEGIMKIKKIDQTIIDQIVNNEIL